MRFILSVEGRRARRREARALQSYTPPPAQDEEDDGAVAVQPPEGEGPNQAAPGVSQNNETLTLCYDDMVFIFRAVEKAVAADKELQADGERLQNWSSVRQKLQKLRINTDDLLSRYDALYDSAERLRLEIRLHGGFPVEPPPLLATHPGSLTFRH